MENHKGEKTMKRRILPLLLTLCLLLGLAVPAAAENTVPNYPKENGFTYFIQNGKATIVGYEDNTITELVIPATLGGCPVDDTLEQAFHDYPNLKKVVLPDQPLTLSLSCFENCTALEEINLHDGIDLGAYSFAGCKSLKTAYLPAPRNPYGRLTSGTFFDCRSLESVEIGEGLAEIPSNTFGACWSLKEVVIPEGVRGIGYAAFQDCFSLTDVTLPVSLDIVSKEAFVGCKDTLTIHGVKGSVAEHAADQLGFPFAETEYPQLFADVPAGQYYSAPVVWAAMNGITKGKTTTSFVPGDQCTRAQMVTFLWRFLGCPDSTIIPDMLPFEDIDKNAYYIDALTWAYEKGITQGTGEHTFSPNKTVTRGQVVMMLFRADKQDPYAGYETAGFTDLREGAYYVDAVNWAAQQGIVTGYADKTFRPDAPCTRAHIVTFLYRNTAPYYNNSNWGVGKPYIC